MPALDQGFKAFGSQLQTTDGPYDPFAGTGDPEDDARYLLQPGINFMRPWLAIRGGSAFQWPLGLEGWQTTVDPSLGIHKFIGDNAVTVEVIHAGEEHFSMDGTFPGDSAPRLVAALRDVVYKESPKEGKILWLPEVVKYAQRVQVVNFTASRARDDRGRDMQYSIEFVRLGIVNAVFNPDPQPGQSQPTGPAKGKASRSINVDSKHRTLRQIAAWKLGTNTKWRSIYDANKKWFVKHNISLSQAPGYRLPLGMKIYF